MTSEEFFELTPAQFHALTLRHKDAYERTELLFGINTAILANHSANSPKKAYKPLDFMPSRFVAKKDETKPKRFSRKKFADELRATLMHSGLVVHSKKADVPPV